MTKRRFGGMRCHLCTGTDCTDPKCPFGYGPNGSAAKREALFPKSKILTPSRQELLPEPKSEAICQECFQLLSEGVPTLVPDGFCSDTCKEKWEEEMTTEPEDEHNDD